MYSKIAHCLKHWVYGLSVIYVILPKQIFYFIYLFFLDPNQSSLDGESGVTNKEKVVSLYFSLSS